MIIGSGMLATAFRPHYADSQSIMIYAAGVSNSRCTDPSEFQRERVRLQAALDQYPDSNAFVYFGTCSVLDPDTRGSAYVEHKLNMEKLVSAHSAHVIARLPQVAGLTSNPHTLLNFLYTHITRHRRFNLYKNATRNIIDIEDVIAIVRQLLRSPQPRRITLNIANPQSCRIGSLVAAMEKSTGKQAVADTLNCGGSYQIETSLVDPIIADLNLDFGDDYIKRVIQKYYGKN